MLGAIPFNGCEIEQTIVQKPLPIPDFEFADTKSLTLHISVPSTQNKGRLPVLVFVHGGGFTTGSSSYPQNDLGNMVAVSVKVQIPIVAVGIK